MKENKHVGVDSSSLHAPLQEITYTSERGYYVITVYFEAHYSLPYLNLVLLGIDIDRVEQIIEECSSHPKPQNTYIHRME